jgi:hypothetical protein
VARVRERSYPPSIYAPPVIPATGATAGTPGTWTPAGSTPPATVAALLADPVTASPATAWTTGQRVVCGDAAPAYWNGTAWVAGTAATVEEEGEGEAPARAAPRKRAAQQ